MSSLDGGFCQLNFWNVKKSLLPKSCDPPIAKKDENGNLLTTKTCLKKLYMNTYQKRLSPAILQNEYLYEDIFTLKDELQKSRLYNLKGIKSRLWNMNELEDALKKLKTNKC